MSESSWTTKVNAARAALVAHDALKATEQTEPELMSNGLPFDPDAWIAWRDSVSKPAYERWDAAMDALAAELGEPNMSRHPSNFRPICEELIA